MQPFIAPYNDERHRDRVITLWDDVFGYEAPHNAPALVIDAKLAVDDGLFFVALDGDDVIGTIMAGYDGHRGWIYSIAVAPSMRNRGIETSLLTFTERQLQSLGCVKINLQVMDDNDAVVPFYEKSGYAIERRISMGKRLMPRMLNDTD